MFSIRKFQKSVLHAARGFSIVFKEEQNFRIQLVFTVSVFFLGIGLGLKSWEMLFVMGSAFILLVLEILNSVLEKIIDLLKPRVHFYAGIIKDMAASAVLVAAVWLLLVVFFLFLPHILNVFSRTQ